MSQARNLPAVQALLSELPEGWNDSSWHNDEYDSVQLDISDTKEYRIWIIDNEGEELKYNLWLFEGIHVENQKELIEPVEKAVFLQKIKEIKFS